MGKKFIIGIGQRARAGKDTVANYIKELRSSHEVHILHWADTLYDEVRNSSRQYPLIKSMWIGKDSYYNLLSTPDSRNYMLFRADEIPVIDELMCTRNISEYWGMNEKDAPMLQAWGTNFRREKVKQSCLVDRTVEKIEQMINQYDLSYNSNKNLYVCVADTRFKNEHDCIKGIESSNLKTHQFFGAFVRVIKLNEDGTQYIDPSRDPNHPSEAELDGIPSDFTLEAKSGDLDTLKQKTEQFLNEIDEKW